MFDVKKIKGVPETVLNLWQKSQVWYSYDTLRAEEAKRISFHFWLPASLLTAFAFQLSIFLQKRLNLVSGIWFLASPEILETTYVQKNVKLKIEEANWNTKIF